MLERQNKWWHPRPIPASGPSTPGRTGRNPAGWLVRTSFDLPEVDPFALIDLTSVLRHSYLAWQRGAEGPCWLAIGSLWQCSTAGPQGFRRAHEFCSSVLEHTTTPGVGPLVVGNFPFSESSPTGPTLRVPRTVVYRSPAGATRVTYHSVIASEADLSHMKRDLRIRHQTLVHHLRNLPPRRHIPSEDLPIPEETYTSWCTRVRHAREAIVRGQLDKVVLARCVCHRHPRGFDPAATARALRNNHPKAATFAMSQPTPEGPAVFVGATPEPLVEVDGTRVATRAIAGTLPRRSTPAQDAAQAAKLLNSPKDRHEHQLVIDMLTRRLGEACTSIHITPTEVLRLPRVMHLQTRLVGTQARAGNIVEWVRRLHPSPAVGGWPCDQAKNYLQAHELLERGPYAAPIGWIDEQGSGQFFVAIRSALLHGDHARAFAGAGIVAGSNPDAEWRETQHKLRSIADALIVRTPEHAHMHAPTRITDIHPHPGGLV